ncbi:hypothetical protein, partial [Escherichia coli]|uniref:hypothetical protein n=1 Tax=Escherichia coli TaxID=562 RepID=UPI0032E4146A
HRHNRALTGATVSPQTYAGNVDSFRQQQATHDDGAHLGGQADEQVQRLAARRRRLFAAASGAVAVGGAVAAGDLVAGVLSPSLSPMTAVGGAVIDAVPPGVKDWAVALFGTA